MLCLFFLVPSTVFASEGDGLYGRLDGDFAYSVAAGAGLELNRAQQGFGIADFRLRYLDTMGLVLAAEMRPHSEYHVVSALDLRPLFLWRFFTNRSAERRFFDLWVDSFGLELGTVVVQSPAGHALGLVLGTGFDLPIWLGRGASGVFLRTAFRYQHALDSDQSNSIATIDDFTVHLLLGFKDFIQVFSY